MSDMVNHPTHYTSHPSGVEVIEIVRHMGFNLGNVVKYVLRCDLKGAEIEDLKKAAWYLNDEISKREKASLQIRELINQPPKWEDGPVCRSVAVDGGYVCSRDRGHAPPHSVMTDVLGTVAWNE